MTTAAHSHKSRKRLALLIGVSLSVLAAFGIHDYAGAAQIIEREEVGGVVFRMSDDDLVGMTVKDQKIRLESGWDPTSDNLPKTAQLEQAFSEMKDAIKKDYGWDVSSSADRKSIQGEMNRLHQVLHTIPDSVAKSEQHPGLSKFRDVVDMLTGVSKCRGRCLQEDETAVRMIPLVAIGAAVAAIEAEFLDPLIPEEYRGYVEAVLTAVMTSVMAWVVVFISYYSGIKETKLRNAIMGGLFATLATLHQYKDDAEKMAEATSSTPKDEAQEDAKAIAAVTPEPNDAPKDYDMVHDEL